MNVGYMKARTNSTARPLRGTSNLCPRRASPREMAARWMRAGSWRAAPAFAALAPSRLAGFAVAWLELISHRMFMPKTLLAKGQRGWPLMHRLLVDLFVFVEPYLRRARLPDAVRALYKGALRVLLVLLHDFPEFLCD